MNVKIIPCSCEKNLLTGDTWPLKYHLPEISLTFKTAYETIKKDSAPHIDQLG